MRQRIVPPPNPLLGKEGEQNACCVLLAKEGEPDTTPLVTLALPLYKSRRFLDIITANLDTITYPHLEILISDRHSADDAIDVLETRYSGDARFHFLRAHDELSWVEHYNTLLRAGTGKYFLWMPHDDSYPANYVTTLVQALERAPDAIAAYSQLIGVASDGTRNTIHSEPPFRRDSLWTWHNAVTLFLDGELWQVMRGLFRRDQLIGQNLFLTPTRDNNAADMVWLFAVACTGRIVWKPDTWCEKRFYGDSTHALWKPHTWRHSLAEIPALHKNLVANQSVRTARLRGGFLVLLWAVIRLGRNALDAASIYRASEQTIRRFLLKIARAARV